MKVILVVLDARERLSLFKRLSIPFKKKGYRFVYLTNRLSLYVAMKLKCEPVFLIEKQNSKGENIELERCMQYRLGELDELNCKEIGWDIDSTLERILNVCNISYVFVWNGYRVVEKAVAQWARRINCPVLFFELGNFPGKIFVDSKGINCESLVAEMPSLLDKLEYDSDRCECWLKNYIESKKENHTVPQARAVQNINWWYSVDYLGVLIGKVRADSNENIVSKIHKKFRRRRLKVEFDDVDTEKDNYVFLPLQVSNDTQLVLNSDVDNLRAIQYAVERSKCLGVGLVVKMHPAEPSEAFIRMIWGLKKKYNFSISNQNTFKLIRNSYLTITVNSTVGLEAKLMKVKIEVLGRSLYGAFTDDQARRYVCSYLLDVDYFSEQVIGTEVVDDILVKVGV